MPASVVADQIDDGRAGAPGVVEVGDAVRKARAQVQKGEGWLLGHSPVAICRPCADALEESEHGADLRHLIEGGDKGKLGRARIREAHLHAGLRSSA